MRTAPCCIPLTKPRAWLCTVLILLASASFAAAQVPVGKPPITRMPGGDVYSIEGRVVGQDGRSPVAEVRVTLHDFKGAATTTLMTDDEGTFAFYGLPSGAYTLVFSHPAFQERSQRISVTTSPETGLRIALEPLSNATSASITGPKTLPVWSVNIPDGARQAYDKGKELIRKKEFERSVPFFEEAVRLYPQYASAHSAMGTAYLNWKQQVEKARAAFDQALQIDDNVLEAQLGLASLDLGKKSYEPAREHLLKARLLKPDDWRICQQLGDTELRLGLYAEAEVNLRRAIELAPESSRTHLLLINVLALQDKLPQTLEAMDEFLRLFPKDPFAAQVRDKRSSLQKQLQTAPKSPLLQ